MTTKDNKKLIIKLKPKLIYDASHVFTNLSISPENTNKIINNESLPWQVTSDDVETIVSLNKALDYIAQYKGKVSLYLYHKINQIVAYDAKDPGYFAYQPMEINRVKWTPPMPSKKRANKFISYYTNLNISYIKRAIKLMLQFDRYQFFWDGNKRTAWLVSNYYLMEHRAGMINIKAQDKSEWNNLLLSFYDTGKLKNVTDWIIKNAYYN